jgi:hypothetical protein
MGRQPLRLSLVCCSLREAHLPDQLAHGHAAVRRLLACGAAAHASVSSTHLGCATPPLPLPPNTPTPLVAVHKARLYLQGSTRCVYCGAWVGSTERCGFPGAWLRSCGAQGGEGGGAAGVPRLTPVVADGGHHVGGRAHQARLHRRRQVHGQRRHGLVRLRHQRARLHQLLVHPPTGLVVRGGGHGGAGSLGRRAWTTL